MPTGRKEEMPAARGAAGATSASPLTHPVGNRPESNGGVSLSVSVPDPDPDPDGSHGVLERSAPTPNNGGNPATATSTVQQGDPDAANTSDQATTAAVSTDASRAGADERRRGWFWHWNSVVTQYAPLIGLKGVGLINSYTVWTDRREESPHRGYAFPSQQSEADFYGEERAELITINKILVALNLIEIRKEMIQRTDERGRKWRVPHNLYRVRDRDDGMQLRASDVLRVADLAARDPAVFRYVRRIFSERFKPIDRDNAWHAILDEVATNPTWQELRRRNQAIEQRASARTKAGHRTRSGRGSDDLSALVTDGQLASDVLRSDIQDEAGKATRATSVGPDNNASTPIDEVVDAASNNGLGVAVEPSNDGLTPDFGHNAARFNTGWSTSVGQGNTTYHQPQSTTTTTTTSTGRKVAVASDSPLELLDGDSTMAADGCLSEQAPSRGRRHNRLSVSGNSQTPTPAHEVEERQHQQGEYQHAPQSEMGSRSDVEADESRAGEPDDTSAVEANCADALTDADRVAQRPESRDAADAVTVDPLAGRPIDDRWGAIGGAARERNLDHADEDAGGPLVDPSPLVVSLFEAANDRRARPLERTLLAELERDADPAARAAGSDGSAWVAAALREAVASGSSFVAPKRIREIISRWALSGMPEPSSLGQATENGRIARTRLKSTLDRPAPTVINPEIGSTNESANATALAGDTGGDVRLPGGRSGSATWTTVLGDLRRTLDPAAYDRLVAGSTIVRYWRGSVEIAVASPAAVEKLSTEYRGLIERQLNARLRRSVSVTFVVESSTIHEGADVHEDAENQATYPTDAPAITASATPLIVSKADLDLGRQLWRAMLDDPRLLLAPTDLDAITGGAVLGEDASGALLVAGLSPRAQRLLTGQHRSAIEQALARLIGCQVFPRFLAASDWRVG